jgi:inner membrane protein
MMFLSHTLFGLLLGFLACNFLNCQNPAVFITLAAISSSFPDIDHLNSKISRKLKPFAIIATTFFTHRSFLHSVFPPLIIYALLVRVDHVIATAILVGYLSHLILDATTTRGIKPFYPLNFKIKGIIKTNSLAEKLIILAVIILTALVFLKY